MKKRLLLAIIAPALSTGLAQGATTIFGTDNDGLDGFATGATVPTTTPAPAWTITATGAVFTNAPTDPSPNPDSGQVNSSLLRQFVVDRSNGSSYSITGVATWTSVFAGDNNRLGISLFADDDTLGGVDTGLSLQYNLGNGQIRILNAGVNGSVEDSSNVAYGGISGATASGTTFTFQADLLFTGTDVEIDFTLTDQNNFSQTTSATVDAATVTGEYFGFGSRGRVRNGNADFIYEAKSFSVIPEPSSALLVGLLGGLALLRRSR